MPNTPEGKVTLAVLSNQLENIEQLLKIHIERAEKYHEDHETRLRILETSKVRLEQQLKIQTGALGTLMVLGSSIATWLGVKF